LDQLPRPVLEAVAPLAPSRISAIQSLRDAGETLYFGFDSDGLEDVVERFEIHSDLRDPSRTSAIVSFAFAFVLRV
jgi:hypothetical protein